MLADPEGNEFCVIEPGNNFLADCGFLGELTCDGSQEVGHFWSHLPACESCGEPPRYDIWASASLTPALLCESCAEPLNGLDLGAGSVTYVLTFAELPWEVRDICDNVTSELGRPSLWV
jgi:hypothetical protein